MHLRSIAPLLALTVLVSACADTGPDDPADTSGADIAHATAPDALLLRWGYEGGFTPPEYQLTNLPSFSLYGDGTVVRPGAQIEIYPGPALPALETIRLDEAGVQTILESAFAADLDTVRDLTDLGSVGVADAPETVITLRAGDVDRTVRVYALGELGGQPPGMPDDEYAARQALLELVNDLGSLESWLPDDAIVDDGVYEPTGSLIFVSRYRGQVDLPQRPIAWPLETPLQDIGVDTGVGFRCVAVTGADWTDRLQPAARQANQLTPWTSAGRRFHVSFRPLLPDGSEC